MINNTSSHEDGHRDRQGGVIRREAVTPTPVTSRAARVGLWALPTYGLLLGLSTLTHQPSIEDFDAYARYVTTDIFLVSHLVASILGAGLSILGVVAVATLLAHGRAARTAVAGLVLTTVTQVFMAAAFGSATFVQPGIGRAHLNGIPNMPALNADTAYGPTFVVTALTATFFLIVSSGVVGVAIARTDRRLRWYGIGYATFTALFSLSGFLFQPIQAPSGFALAIVTAAFAVQLPRLAQGTTGVRAAQGNGEVAPEPGPHSRSHPTLTTPDDLASKPVRSSTGS